MYKFKVTAMTSEQKKWIDEASYETLLHRWRSAAAGDTIFQGESGQYYSQVMDARRDADPAAHVTASKRIG
jgi:PII-like signaling protein